MPPLPSRMTKNAVKDFRYRPGKAEVEDDDDEYESDEEDENEEQEAKPAVPAPKPFSFPSKKKLAIDLSRADQQRTTEAPQAKADDDLDGFVTASESEGEDDKKDSDDSEDDDDDSGSSEEEESSSDYEPKKPMLAPKFLSKAQRAKQASAQQPSKSASDLAAEAETVRLQKADEALRAQIALDAAARAEGKKAWDDDDNNIADEVDDTDDLDPEAERAAWKLRELKRVRRDRLAIEEKEAEREEIERRRYLTAEEREAEDAEFIRGQQEEREGKGKMAFMQKYYHKGAFFQNDEEQDEEVKAALNRDLAGARFEDEAGSKDVLPEYMKIRDMSLLGRKGRTKYKDLKSEDTGRWGVGQGRKREYDGVDDRFRPDDHRDGGRERTGANDIAVGERRPKREDGEREEKRTRYE